MKGSRRIVAVLAAAAALAPAARAQRIEDVPRVHAITGARIVTAPGQSIERGTIVLRDGLVEAVGANVTAPPDARIWDLSEVEGATVYPGLIDAYVSRPWPEKVVEAEKEAQGLHPNELVRPARQMLLFAGDEAAAKRLREAGFTTALVAPRGGLFRGQSAIVNLGAGTGEDDVLRPSFGQHVTVEPSGGGGYPESLMGAVALFRQTVLDTRWYGQAREAFRKNPSQERPAVNLAWEALAPAVAGRQPMVFDTDDVLDTLRVARLAADLELSNVVLVGNGHEYERIDAVKGTGFPHLLPVSFPEPPTPTGEGDVNVELAALRHWDLAPGNPAAMIATGLPVAFTAEGLDDPKKLHENLGQAIERGLTPEQALAAVTVVPAKLLGIDAMVGTLAKGKVANLVIAEGELFTADTKIREVWVDGNRYEVKETKAPEVEPAGTWSLAITTGDGQQLTADLELSGEASALTGIFGVMGQKLSLSDVTVSGKTIEIAFDGAPLGMPGTISMTLDVSGERLRGSGTSPMGPFTVKGERLSRPSPEVIR